MYTKIHRRGFDVLCERFLEILGNREMAPSTLRRYWVHYRTWVKHLGNMEVKDITYGILEDTKLDLDLAPKTIYDLFGFLKAFMNWCIDRDYLAGLPKFPALSKKMGMREILDKETQRQVVNSVYEIYGSSEPRAAIGIELLATYPKIRPGELRQVTEGHLDLADGWLTIPNPKEQSDPKVVKLIPKHVKQLKEITDGNPTRFLLSFSNGQRFGRDYLYLAWRRAAATVGVTVSLYPGTKHTTVTALAKEFTYSQVKKAANVNSKAMERYINLAEDDVVSLYERAAP